MGRQDDPIDGPRGESGLRDPGRGLFGAERRERGVRDLSRKVDDAAGERVTGGEHGVEPREGVEAVEAELGPPGQALDLRAHVSVLEVLAEQQPVSLEGPGNREPGLELVDERESLAEARDEVVGFDDQSLVPRLVRTWVTLVENLPYSAANGFDRTSTESTAPLGSSRSKSPVEGSLRLALLICSAPAVGAPPFTRNRPSGPRMMLGSTVSSDWKSSPASGWMSILFAVRRSLTATG